MMLNRCRIGIAEWVNGVWNGATSYWIKYWVNLHTECIIYTIQYYLTGRVHAYNEASMPSLNNTVHVAK